jgi:hypothetical protein
MLGDPMRRSLQGNRAARDLKEIVEDLPQVDAHRARKRDDDER